MIDIHSHILYGVDDGSKSVEETLEMLVAAVDEGITEIIATPHSFHPQYHADREEIEKQVVYLNQAIAEQNIELKIHVGQEVRLVEDLLQKLQNNEAIPLAKSKYLLLELPSHTIPTYTDKLVIQLQKEGIIPIIAHPERNLAIAKRPEKLEALVRNGAMSQITAGSLVGHFGKEVQKLSLDLVKANLVHTYGSDVHHLIKRPFLFEAGLSYLEKHKQAHVVDMFLENNARLIENKPFVIYEPQLVQKKWWKVF